MPSFAPSDAGSVSRRAGYPRQNSQAAGGCAQHARRVPAANEPAEIDRQASAVNQTQLLGRANRVALDDEVRAALLKSCVSPAPGNGRRYLPHDVIQVSVRCNRRNNGPSRRHLSSACAKCGPS